MGKSIDGIAMHTVQHQFHLQHSPQQKIRAIWMYVYHHHLHDFDYFVSGVRDRHVTLSISLFVYMVCQRGAYMPVCVHI